MPLQYRLVPDPTPENPNQQKAEIVNQKEVTLDEVIDLVMQEGNINMSKKEAKAIVESYFAALHLAHIDGKILSTPLIDVTESGLEPGPKLREVAQKIEVQKVEKKNL